MLLPGPLLLYVSTALHGTQAARDNTAAAAGLASSLSSLVKRAVQHIRSAVDLQSGPAAAVIGEADAAAVYFPAAALHFEACIATPAGMLADWFGSTETAAAGAGNAVGSSSSSQAAANAVVLAVVLARSLVQLADAMEAAGPEVFFKSLLGRPLFRMRWLNEPAAAKDTFSTQQNTPCREDQHIAEVQWQEWQLAVLKAMQQLWAAFKSVGIAQSAAGAAETAAAAASTSAAAAATAAATATATAASEALAGDADLQIQSRRSSIGSTSNSSSSSAGQCVKWGYLLRLQQCSPQWAAAVAAYDANQPNWEDVQAGALPSTAAAAEQHSQHYADAIGLCRALVAAVVCNNPSCENIEGVSEAAAASKACAGCRYCSVVCQRADWKRHKGACRRMAADGQACV
jgi:hypothetical protein